MKALKLFATLCLGSMLVASCTPDNGEGNNSKDAGLVLSLDKSFIYDNNGATSYGVATFTVTYNDVVLNEGEYTIYEEVNLGNKITEDVALEGSTYTSNEQGNHYFWAEYGLEFTKTKTLLMVVATPPAAPAVPTDNNPEKLNFKQRVLITQFTGTDCGFCPGMINALHIAKNNPVYGDKFIIAAAHLYNDSDPAYLSDTPQLASLFGVSGYPTINGNMYKNEGNKTSEAIIELIDDCFEVNPIKGGIAVKSEYHASAKYIVLSALVKAKESAEFRIGAWLVEDGIKGSQANGGFSPEPGVDFNTHNNCIRMVNSRQNYKDYSGLTLGTINAGESKSYEFAFPIANGWKGDNLHVVVFISTKDKSGKWYVNNVVNVDKNGSVDFEYTE